MTRTHRERDTCDVIVVGAGPAGMMAAIAAARGGAAVTVCEHLDRPGVKLLSTGGGRCNLANTEAPDRLMRRFGRQGRFMAPALAAMGCEALRAMLERLGVPTYSDDQGRVFPLSNSAASVHGALWRRCEELNVAFRLRSRGRGLCIRDAVLGGLETDGGLLEAPRVILATGGLSYPQLGATGDGLVLARQAGHEIVEPVAALVPLIAKETWVRACAGVSLSPARAWIDLPGCRSADRTGEVLITHTGVSGPAILDISAEVAQMLRHDGSGGVEGAKNPPAASTVAHSRPPRLRGRATVPIRLDPAPGIGTRQWMERFEQWRREHGTRSVCSLLDRHLPASLARTVCALALIGQDTRAAHLGRRQREELAGLLTGLPLTVTGTAGLDKAMVTRGGVGLKQVDPRTLQSRIVTGLFFAGELLDLDGPTGGYNLLWAFSSGHLAGKSAAESPV